MELSDFSCVVVWFEDGLNRQNSLNKEATIKNSGLCPLVVDSHGEFEIPPNRQSTNRGEYFMRIVFKIVIRNRSGCVYRSTHNLFGLFIWGSAIISRIRKSISAIRKYREIFSEETFTGVVDCGRMWSLQFCLSRLRSAQ